jgi:hypothetical protein
MKKIKRKEYNLFRRIMDEHFELTYNPETNFFFDKYNQPFGCYFRHADRFDVMCSNFYFFKSIFDKKIFHLILLFLLERFPDFEIKKFHNYETCLELLTPTEIKQMVEVGEEIYF